MGGEDGVVRSLLAPELIVPCVRFSVPGVTLRVPSGEEGEEVAVTGTLMLVRQHPNAVTAFDTFLVWAPYTYLLAIAPSLLTPAARGLVSSTLSAMPGDKRSELVDFEQSKTICLCVANIAKVQRKTNLRGRRTIIIQRVGREWMEQPLGFADGGSTPFIDELKSLVELRVATGEARDVWTVHCTEPTAATDDSPSHEGLEPTSHVDPNVSRGSPAAMAPSASGSSAFAESPINETKTSAGSTSAGAGSSSSGAATTRLEFEKDIYGAPASATKSGSRQGFVRSVLRMGKAVADRSSHFVVAVASELTDLVAETPTSIQGQDDSEFDVVEMPVAIENMVPKIVPPQSAPRMGQPLRPSQWNGCFDADGRLNLTAYNAAKETAFRGGIESSIRAEVWPFLLGVFAASTTAEERQAIRRANHEQYQCVKQQWSSVSAEQADHFTAFRERKAMVEKDVVRTDRRLPQFAADDAPMLRSLFNVLMTYSFFNFDVGYCQGMSDFLAPILLLYEEEEMAFAVFKALMATRTVGNFYNDSRHTMSKQLDQLRVLVQSFVPKLYRHLESQEALDMTFAFRWLLVHFKREFSILQIALLWDVTFACPFTAQYELFMVAALLRGLTGQIIEHNLSKDELIRFCNAVGGNMKIEDLIVMTYDFYDLVAQQYGWRRKTAAAASSNTAAAAGTGSGAASKPTAGVAAGGAYKDQRPSLDDIVKEYDANAKARESNSNRHR